MRRFLFLLLLLVNTAIAQKIRIATYQYADNPRIKNLEPLAAGIHARTGLETTVVSYPTVQQFITAIQQGEVELAFINTFGYLLLETAQASYPMQPSAAMVSTDSTARNYRSAFIVPAASPVKNWKDIVDHAAHSRLALVFSGSTSGNLVPRLGLTNLGIADAEKVFQQVTYTGTHASALQAVLTGSADIAAMGSAEFEKLTPEQQARLRVIWESPDIPLGPALISTRILAATSAILANELRTLHTTDPVAFNSLKMAWSESQTATLFIPVTNTYYDPFIERFGEKKQVFAILQQFAR
mgnify:CR=1 FL=1